MAHPLQDFIYCPHCGSSHFLENTPFSKRCMDCNFVFFPNAVAATVAVIINEKNEILCIRRKYEPAKGTLDLPGGFVDPGESVTEGLCREVREELGAEVATYKFLFSFSNVYPYSGHDVYTADSFFLCRLKDYSTVTPNDDAVSIHWMSLSTISLSDFGLSSIRHGVEKLLLMQRDIL